MCSLTKHLVVGGLVLAGICYSSSWAGEKSDVFRNGPVANRTNPTETSSLSETLTDYQMAPISGAGFENTWDIWASEDHVVTIEPDGLFYVTDISSGEIKEGTFEITTIAPHRILFVINLVGNTIWGQMEASHRDNVLSWALWTDSESEELFVALGNGNQERMGSSIGGSSAARCSCSVSGGSCEQTDCEDSKNCSHDGETGSCEYGASMIMFRN